MSYHTYCVGGDTFRVQKGPPINFAVSPFAGWQTEARMHGYTGHSSYRRYKFQPILDKHSIMDISKSSIDTLYVLKYSDIYNAAIYKYVFFGKGKRA